MAANKIKFNKNLLINIKTSQEPSQPDDIPHFDSQMLYDKMKLYKTYHKVWTITRVVNENMPTWNACNSFISKEK